MNSLAFFFGYLTGNTSSVVAEKSGVMLRHVQLQNPEFKSSARVLVRVVGDTLEEDAL